MSININYSNKVPNKKSANVILFSNDKFNIINIKKFLSVNEFKESLVASQNKKAFIESYLKEINYYDYQQELCEIIKEKHDSGIGYRRISYWLNKHGYKTPRGHEFKNTHI